MDKVSVVTARTYADKARAFMQAQQQETGTFGVLIDPQNEPQNWGAWLGYFNAIKRHQSAASMKRIHRQFVSFYIRQDIGERRASLSYLVPATFPSDFDEAREWLDDKIAGDKFMDWFQAELDKRASVSAIPPEDRARIVQAAMKGTNLMKNLDWRPGQ